MYKKISKLPCPYCRKDDEIVMITYKTCNTKYIECERCWTVIGEVAN